MEFIGMEYFEYFIWFFRNVLNVVVYVGRDNIDIIGNVVE